MNERVKFIARYLEEAEPFSGLCSDFGISRKTGYKWIERYDADGVEALEDQSRKPKNHPQAVSEEIIKEILSVRRRHPRWGPRKLLVVIRRQRQGLILPVASTVGEILKRNGLIKARRKRIRSSSYGEALGGYNFPNAIWCADFKGHFAVGNDRCHPLTVSDGYSRKLLRCQALSRPLHEPVQKAFASVFEEYGLPDAIRTDNGSPFSTLAPGGLSRLSVWWIKLGIKPERIQPGRPDQNGRHERMHSTLKAETAKPPKTNMRAQQREFDHFVKEYNEIRPHESLGQKVPDSFYKPSLRPFPKKLPEIEYPPHLRVEKTYPNGVVSLGQTQWYISGCLKEEYLGLEEVDDDVWKVYFGPIALGILDGQNAKQVRSRHFGSMIRIDGETKKRRRFYRR